MFGQKLKNPIVLKLLSNVLKRKETIAKVSPVSPNGEEGMYNFYSMLTIIDAIIKYQIIIGSSTYFETYIGRLNQLTSVYHNHEELVIGINTLLGEMVRVDLGLSDLVQYENKRKVLEQVYNKYIVNGYCFHSFSSFFKEKIEENGINSNNYKYPISKMKKIAYIFENHHYSDFIKANLDKKKHSFFTTDSMVMAYYYAISAPTYFSNMAATSPYMKGEDYDYFAYCRKDYEACLKNLKKIGKHIKLSSKEESIVEEAFLEQWQALKVSESIPCIAFIDRKVVGRNSLENIKQILEEAKDENFVVSMAKILDSRYSNDKHLTPILSLDFTVEEMPSYQEILEGSSHEELPQKVISVLEDLRDTIQIKPLTEIEIEDEEEEPYDEEPQLFPQKPVNNYGNADVIALFGLLSIMSGLTLYLIFNYFGIR